MHVPQMPNQGVPDHRLGDTWARLGTAEPAEAGVTILLTEDQVPQGLQAARYPGSQLFMVQLSAFKQAAWSTLQADLLFVVWELMGGKTRSQTQEVTTLLPPPPPPLVAQLSRPTHGGMD